MKLITLYKNISTFSLNKNMLVKSLTLVNNNKNLSLKLILSRIKLTSVRSVFLDDYKSVIGLTVACQIFKILSIRVLVNF